MDDRDDEIKEELSQLQSHCFVYMATTRNVLNLLIVIPKRCGGGLVFFEEDYPNILCKDGEIYDFDGRKAIAIGGAYSIDKYYRLYFRLAWFESEQPDEYTKKYVENKLEAVGWKVDYALSHTGPLKYLPYEKFLPDMDQSQVDKSTEEWLDYIEDNLNYETWYFGHYHCNIFSGKTMILYEEIVALGE